MKSAAALDDRRPVWDLFVRFFHWTLVACVLTNSFILDDGETVHQWAGYLASALVLSRVVWGFIGSRHARFADFSPTPSRITQHLRSMLSGQIEFHRGHNPLGALMMMALMGLVLALGLTGWMQGLDAYWGEAWLQDLHKVIGEGLIVLVGLHAAAAIVMGRLERTRLVKAMITGVKERY
jgi:cytochrome b